MCPRLLIIFSAGALLATRAEDFTVLGYPSQAPSNEGLEARCKIYKTVRSKIKREVDHIYGADYLTGK